MGAPLLEHGQRLRRQLWDRALIFFLRMQRRVRQAWRSWQHRSSGVQAPISLPMIAVSGIGSATSSVAQYTVIAALANALRRHGQVPHIWIRGSNVRQTRFFHRPKTPNGLHEDAFILSQSLPLWICRHPEAAATAAAYAGATVLILAERGETTDTLAQFCMAIIDESAETLPLSFWNPYWSLLARSDAIVLIDGIRGGLNQMEVLRSFQPLVWSVSWQLKGSTEANKTCDEQPIIGFTGLNDAGVFFRALLKAQVALQEFIPLSYQGRRVERAVRALSQKAQKRLLVTTSLDMLFLTSKLQKHVRSVSLQVDIPMALVEQILEVCGGTGATSEVA